MDGRRGSPARLLAPISLVAFVFALIVVIGSSDTPDGSGDDGGRSAQRQGEANAGQTVAEQPRPRVPDEFYTVKTGDTLAAIAETVGVPVERLQELNPDLDPQALVSGQKIRLRE